MRKASRIALVFAAVGLAVSATSCSSCRHAGSEAAREDVALMPKESGFLAMVNVSRMRDTAMWRKLLDLRDQAAAERKKQAAENKEDTVKDDSGAPKDLEDFVAKCGLDPFKDIDSVFFALPSQTGDGEFSAVMRGRFDQKKLVDCGKAMAKKNGGDLAESEYDGKKLYNDTSSGTLFVSFLDDKTILFGGSLWIKRSLDLATGKGDTKESAKDNKALMDLMKKARTSDALWVVGIVSDKVRDELKANDKLQAAGSIKDLYASIDFASGMTLQGTIDLGSDKDAKEVASKVGEQLTDAKKNAQIMMLGLASYVDALKTESQDASFKLSAHYNQQQVEDLVNRITGAFKGLAGARGMGGFGAPGLGMPQ